MNIRHGTFLMQRGETTRPLPPAASGTQTFRAEVVSGLSELRKSIPAKYLYDRAGSELFEQITQLPEYYPWRCELALLKEAQDELADLLPAHAHLIEYGAGSLLKVRFLLDAMREPANYVPVDISSEWLLSAGKKLAADYPCLRVRPITGDFTEPFHIPLPHGPRVAFFPGSTLGNFTPVEAVGFLSRVAGHVGHGGALVIGIDLKKDGDTLWRAYNDAAGITAAFNRNLLTRINREIGAGFDPMMFRHHAPYNQRDGRVEMHLVSDCTQAIYVGGRLFCFRQGESIHTENSYKYTVPDFHSLVRRAGFVPRKVWTDGLFSVHYLQSA